LGKDFSYNGNSFKIPSPEDVTFENGFLRETYEFAYGAVAGGEYRPEIDTDALHDGDLGYDIMDAARRHEVAVRQPSRKATNTERLLTQFHVQVFLDAFPGFVGLFYNVTISARTSIKNAEFLLGETSGADNFIKIKSIIDDINRRAWKREKDVSERQAGVSNLGTISEALLGSAFEGLVDGENLFKVGHSQVQSYGDFVLMCLPNNLWISVKSNFARERLLASGYSNDILGVGFFESAGEFIGSVRVRNLQRAGFLAMYCPDFPVSEAQLDEGTSTYHEIEELHAGNGTEMPRNINGKPFIRPLSSLPDDLRPLLDEPDIRKRFTVDF